MIYTTQPLKMIYSKEQAVFLKKHKTMILKCFSFMTDYISKKFRKFA